MSTVISLQFSVGHAFRTAPRSVVSEPAAVAEPALVSELGMVVAETGAVAEQKILRHIMLYICVCLAPPSDHDVSFRACMEETVFPSRPGSTESTSFIDFMIRPN